MRLKSGRFASDKSISVLLYCFFTAAVCFFNLKLTVPMVLDETSTMSIAAYLVGNDWSLTNLALGRHYYKYLQPLFYVPIFKFCHDPFLTYRLIMLFHALVLGLIPVICYYIGRNYLHLEKRFAVLVSLGISTLSAVTLYAQYARGDLFLELFPWLAILVLLESARALEMKRTKKAAVMSILAALFSVCGYASHTRGVVLVLAVFLSLLLVTLLSRKKIIIWSAYLPSLAVFMLADRVLSRMFKQAVLPFGVSHGSLSNLDKSSYADLFSFAGIKVFLKMMLGWLYNSAASTFGLCTVGIIAAIVFLIYYIRRRRTASVYQAILVSVSFSLFAGSLMMGLLFFYPHVKDIFFNELQNRSDRIVYGRYVACCFGPVSMLGIMALLNRDGVFRLPYKIVCAVCNAGVIILFSMKVAIWIDNRYMTLRNLISLCRFLNLSNPSQTVGSYENISTALIKMGLFSLCLAMIILISSHLKNKLIFLAIIILLNSENFVANFNEIRMPREQMVADLSVDVYQNMKPLFSVDKQYKTLYSEATLGIKNIQVLLPDFVCLSKNGKKYIDQEDMFYILRNDSSDVLKEAFKKNAYYEVTDIQFAHNNTLYITGNELKGKLEEMGYTLIRHDPPDEDA